jgi:hypothetical protein
VRTDNMGELKKLWAKRNKLHKRTQVRLSVVDDILLSHRRQTISAIDRKINDIRWYTNQNKRSEDSKYTY